MTPPMNPHQKPQEDVVVTQEDREAASDMLSESWSYEAATGHVRTGQWDDHPLVQAFARHRLLGHEAGRRDMREAAGWQPIETAPNNGTVILYATPEIDDWRYHMSRGDDRYNGAHWLMSATHWMPLPTEPLGGER